MTSHSSETIQRIYKLFRNKIVQIFLENDTKISVKRTIVQLDEVNSEI